MHAIRKPHRHRLVRRDIYRLQWIRTQVDLNHSIFVVRNLKVHVREQEIPVLCRRPPAHDLLHFPDESPNRQVVERHLKVVVILHRPAKLLHLFPL